MPTDSIPLLWLCGPSGVGKSTVGWALFSRFVDAEIRAGYLDIDQLGMCYPATATDPERHAIKARNLGMMVDTFRAANARRIVVSGVVDPVGGIDEYSAHLSGTSPTLCRLRANRDVLADRMASRGPHRNVLEAALEEAALLDSSDFSDLSVDTSGRSSSEVVDCVTEKVAGWPDGGSGARSVDGRSEIVVDAMSAPGPILWLCGPTGVGKSVVGWEVFCRAREAGVTSAFVDLEQIGFCRPTSSDDPENHRVKARNLAGMWSNFRQSGAQCLVVVGKVERPDDARRYTEALPEADWTLCRLDADRATLRGRIHRRGAGEGPRLAGDGLRGQPPAELDRVADRAGIEAEALRRAGIGDICVDTEDTPVEDAAEAVISGARDWPSRP